MLQPATVADVMTDNVYAFPEETSIEKAARALVRRKQSGAPVVTATGRPIGVISIADLIRPGQPLPGAYPHFYRSSDNRLETGIEILPSGQGPVADVMSPFVLSIESTATIVEAAGRMIGENVHRLLVMRNGALVGIVTSIDLLRGFTMLLRA